MDYDDFIWFIEEMERIRSYREEGHSHPLTNDFILDNCNFLSIHHKHDPSTIRLHQFINKMTDWEKIFYIILFRTCDSSILQNLTGIWMHDYRNIKYLDIDLIFEGQSYRNPIVLKNDLLLVSFPAIKSFFPIMMSLNNSSLYSVEEELYKLLKPLKRSSRLISALVASDLVMQFQSKIDSKSECRFCIEARLALKKLPGRRNNCKIEKLLHSTGLNYSSLNRALNQWWQYLTRKKYYEETGCLRDEWLIQIGQKV